MDNVGWSIPFLFNVTAGFLFFWTTTLYFIYKIFCKKYEEILIRQKEEEISSLQQNKSRDSSSIPNRQGNVGNGNSDEIFENGNDLEFEDNLNSWKSQMVGITRL